MEERAVGLYLDVRTMYCESGVSRRCTLLFWLRKRSASSLLHIMAESAMTNI